MKMVIENFVFQWKDFLIEFLPAIKMICFFAGMVIVAGIAMFLQYCYHERKYKKRNHKKSP